ncbi:MAG: metallophosphoesterase family protein [Candidatus Thorarchaeota archaeon SMTZ1-45]|nr:MAG: hypothetical protein AM325_14855 [Candidatus Thorarchaeota archaeon SMTZ1-45]
MEFLILTDIHDSWIHIEKMIRLAEEMDGVIFLGDLMTFRKFTQVSIDNFTKLKERSNWMVSIPGNGPVAKVLEFLDDLGINLHGKGKRIEDIGFFGVGGVQETLTTISEIREFFRTEDTSTIEPDNLSLETLNAFGITHDDRRFIVEEWSESEFSALDVYKSPFELSEKLIFEVLSTALAQIKDAPLKILLSHVPPFEPGIISASSIGVSTGSKSIARFIHDNLVDLAISGHYHKHHEFQIENTKCVVVPAVINGFYGVLSSNTSMKELRTEIRKF